MSARSLGGALAIVIATTSTAHADERPWYRSRRHVANVAITVGAAALYLSTETFLELDLSPTDCRWCHPTALDVHVRNALLWDDPTRARTISDVTGFAVLPAFSIGLVALGSYEQTGEIRVVEDLVPIVETVAVSQLFVQGIKYVVARERPFVHYGSGLDEDDYVSFLSGHSALAFAVVTSAGVVAHERHYASEPYIWAIGLPLAATTAYLRIAADKHYFTDVTAGAALGVAAGLIVPTLATRVPVEVVPTENGVTVLGMW